MSVCDLIQKKVCNLTPLTGCFADADDMTTTGASQSPSGGEHGQSSVSQGGRHEGQLQRRQTGTHNIKDRTGLI